MRRSASKLVRFRSFSVGSLTLELQQLSRLFDRDAVARATLLVIFVVAALFRLHGLNWDGGRGLHPDERFLTQVTNDISWPEKFDTYFDPQTSSLSPYVNPNIGLFVYGTFPVYLTKWVAIRLDRNTYDQIPLVGRALSGLFDVGSIALLYLIGRRLYGRRVALLGSALLALSVLNIQLSHFYTVDTFAVMFALATIYCVLRAMDGDQWSDYLLAGLMFGLGLASKISVGTLAVPIALGLAVAAYRRLRGGADVRAVLEHGLLRLAVIFGVAALVFRILQPIAFAGPGFWNLSLNPRWLDDIREQRDIVSGKIDLPWLQQWTNRPASFAVYNIVVWGLGLPLGIAGFAGLGLAAVELVRRRKVVHLLPVAYVVVTFVYHAATFVKFMRYFLPIYPFLALLAAYGVGWLWRLATRPRDSAAADEAGRRWRAALPAGLALTLGGVLLVGTLGYALAFSAIYGRTHTRIAASRWLFANVAPGAVLANEHWDDWLPIGGVDGKIAYGDDGVFGAVEMGNYEDDTPEKLARMVDNLAQADYVILSSDRLAGSIPRLPLRYPMTTRYYQLLQSGALGFERVAEFTSYPTIFGIQIADTGAEEAFSVYDHPRVQVFRKTAAFSAEAVRQQLGDGIVWSDVVHLTPWQATVAPTALQLTAADQQRYAAVAATSSAEVRATSWGSRAPVLAWFLVVQLLSLAALPLTLVAFANFVDRGYLLSKLLGLLIAGWAAWMLASLRVAPFTWWTILGCVALLGLASLEALRARGRVLRGWLRAHARLVLVEEALFWGCFALALYVRWRNPDLWHPGLGGEKPMDLAYLTAITRTPYFPAYDPWFAGGYINYYYVGFVLVATLIHLSGVVPAVAYNLAVPTLYAMTASAAFVVALNLAARRGRSRGWLGVGRGPLLAGFCGALFVAVIGNLGQVQLLWNGIRALSTLPMAEHPTVLAMLRQFGDGLRQKLDGQSLQFRTEWWYWNATRVIPAGQGEAGPINEMPIFTFLFADLHAHMMALPYTLLALALALNVVRSPIAEARPATTRWSSVRGWEWLTLGLLALTTGALWTINTWDFPTYIVVGVVALAVREYGRRGRIDVAGLWAVGWRAALVVVAGRLLFQPYHAHYAGAYFGAELWRGSRTPLWAYLIIHGFFLFVLGSYMAAELHTGRGHNAVVRRLRLALRGGERRARADRLVARLVRPTGGYALAFAALRTATVVGVVALVLRPVVGVALLLALLVALLVLSRPAPRRQLALCLIGLGLLLTAMVEIVVLKGDISRMNTVFKFYLQVWVLWSVAAAAVVPQLIQGRPRPRRAPIKMRERAWSLAFALLLVACCLYPATATPVRIRDRFEDSTARTLDGTAYMRTAFLDEQSQPMQLEWDREAIVWLQTHVTGLPTILEASGRLYGWTSRVAINTGLPTVIGWDWHQKQQRAAVPGDRVDRRIADVATIYTGMDPTETVRLLKQYGVRFIYVGQLERITYAGDGLAKFDANDGTLWDAVYRNDQVAIYQVR